MAFVHRTRDPDRQRFIRREVDMQRQVGAHGKRLFARDMAAILGKTGHKPAAVDGRGRRM